MEQSQPNNKPRPVRRSRVRLPFEKRQGDIGEWTYDHRIGISITLIAYLVLAIVFVAGRIVIDAKPHSQTIYIDLQVLEQLEAERDRLEQKTKERTDNADWHRIQNLVSNENAKEAGDKGSHGVSDPSGGNKGLQDRMKANRDAYEKGLAEERDILNSKESSSSKSDGVNQRVNGRVTVSYSFAEPMRTHRANQLVIPAYRCEGGGEVVVRAQLNKSGGVVSADVISGGDACMRESALSAARNSQFNIDGNAPQKHQGTITYVFIPQ